MSKCRSIGCGQPIKPGSDWCVECSSDMHSMRFTDLSQSREIQVDPNGKAANEPGAKLDAGKVRMHLITGGMARAITEVAKVATFGAAKYTDGGWVDVPDGFRRYEDAQQRHAALRHMGEEFDSESRLHHLSHEAWNALAKLDLYLRSQE